MSEFKNQIIEINKEELISLIEDFNSDSITKHNNAESELTSKIMKWISQINNTLDSITASFKSYTGQCKIRNIPVQINQQKYHYIKIYSCTNDNIIITIHQNNITINIDDLYDDMYLYSYMSQLATPALSYIQNNTIYEAYNIYRYKKDMRTIQELFNLEFDTTVSDVVNVLYTLGFEAEYKDDESKNQKYIYFTSFGSDNFTDTYKNAVRELLGDKFDSFDYISNTQFIYLK